MTKRKALAFLSACSTPSLTEVTLVLLMKLPGQDLPLQREIKLGWNKLWLKYYNWRYLIWTDMASQMEFGSLLVKLAQKSLEKVHERDPRDSTTQNTCKPRSPSTPS